MNDDLFADLVVEALDSLPAAFQEQLDNVTIVVEDWPDAATRRAAGIRSPYGLLGFYHGVPKTGRGANYGLVAPDKISIYRGPIMAICRTDEELRETVHRVVLHELAHHFGIDDDRLHAIGAY